MWVTTALRVSARPFPLGPVKQTQGGGVVLLTGAVRFVPSGSRCSGMCRDGCSASRLASLFPGTADAFIIRFVCNDDLYPGTPKFLHQDIDSALGIRNTFFEFETALACVPSPVDCQVTGKAERPGLRRPVEGVRVCVCVYARM